MQVVVIMLLCKYKCTCDLHAGATKFQGYLFHYLYKIPIAASHISLVATSEKVVIVILLARICVTV